MKTTTTLLLATSLSAGILMTGCQTTHRISAPTNHSVSATVLQAYNWQLVDAKYQSGEQIAPLFFDATKPLILNFMTDRVVLSNVCNNINASYQVKNSKVQLGNITSTEMACPAPQAKFDTAAAATIDGMYSVSTNANKVPILTITGTDRIAHFKAVAK